MFRYLVILSSVHVGPFLILGDLINCKGDHSTSLRIAKEMRMKGKRSEVTIRVLIAATVVRNDLYAMKIG